MAFHSIQITTVIYLIPLIILLMAFSQLTQGYDDIFSPTHYPVHGFSQHPDNYGDLFNHAHYPVNLFS